MNVKNLIVIALLTAFSLNGSTSSTARPRSRLQECSESPLFGKRFELNQLPFSVSWDAANTFTRGELVVIRITDFETGESYYKVGCFTGRTSRTFARLYKINFSFRPIEVGHATIENIGKIIPYVEEKPITKQPLELE